MNLFYIIMRLMAINLEPLSGRVLVELKGEYANIEVSEKKWNDKISGIVLKVGDEDLEYLVGKRIWWDQFGVEIDSTHAFVRYIEIMGYADV